MARPGAAVRHKAQESGLEYLRELANGAIVPPPVAQVLGMTVVKADPGPVQFTMPVREFFTNHRIPGRRDPLHHHGFGARLRDNDVDLNVDFLRPLSEASGLVTVDAEVVHPGRNRGLASCRAVDSNGRVCASARAAA